MHIGTWDHPGFLGRACTLEDAIDVMGAAGVSGGAIVPTDQCDNTGLLQAAQDAIASGYPGRLWFFAWPRVSEDGASQGDLQWLDNQRQTITGVKLHPSLSRKRITDPAFAPILERADEREWVVLVHCGRWQEMASYRFAIEAAGRYPRARFLLAHGGGDTPPLATAASELVREKAVSNVWFEFSGLREYWVIERTVARIGAERYLMGSDYCLAHPSMYVGAVKGMALSSSAKERILGANALELFGASLGEAS